ncbi:FMN-binding protein [Arthrobacter pityocampae]|uniref:FMN-binding protein n=1 Tax=Arthrobacter pityocampae TaxID=547334 RepID=UPI0037354080
MTRTSPTRPAARTAAGTLGVPRHKRVLTALAAVSILGAAGCAGAEAEEPPAGTPASEQPMTDATTPATGGEAEGAGTAGVTYRDGTYSDTGAYQSPAGQEEVGVTLTLEADVVTGVEVEPMPDNPTTTEYQGRFAGGIADAVVGKKLDELSVDKVAGSSLTSGGFNDALGKIKSEARL